MKKVKLEVEIVVSDDITTKEQVRDITENVMEALVNHVNGSEKGIVGDDFEGYTKELIVSSPVITKLWEYSTNRIETL